VSEGMIGCLSKLYEGIKFYVWCCDNEMTSFVAQTKGVREGYILSPYLFITFIDDIIENVSEANPNAPTIGDVTTPRLLCADDWAVGAFMVNGMQKAIVQVAKYCRN
jgi:hypothetical protein